MGGRLCASGRQTLIRVIVSVLLFCTVSAAATNSWATPIFSAGAGSRAYGSNSPSICPPSATSCTFTRAASNGFGLGMATATAAAGSVAAQVNVSAQHFPNQRPGFATLNGAYATARAVFDDVIISGPTPTVPTLIPFHAGGVTTSTNNGMGVSNFSNGTIDIKVFDPLVTDRFNFNFTGPGVVNPQADIGVLDLTTNVPITVELSIFLEAEIYDVFLPGEPSFPSNLNLNFANTVSFATSGPAFILPAGYTVNSVSANIVNNRWLGAPYNDVPTPSPIILLVFGLAGIGYQRRKRVKAA